MQCLQYWEAARVRKVAWLRVSQSRPYFCGSKSSKYLFLNDQNPSSLSKVDLPDCADGRDGLAGILVK